MNKYAACFGLNRVDPGVYGGWDGLLAACQNDAGGLSASFALCGFTVEAFFDAECTVERMEHTLQHLAEIAEPGDVVAITYSGHGGSNDGVETLCLYNGEMPDWYLRNLLAAFQPGVQVLLIFDSCHSGGMDRNTPFHRVRNKPTIVPAAAYSFTRASPAAIAADCALLAACGRTQTAQDGAVNGAFTGALLRAFSTAYLNNQQATVKSLFETAKNDLNNRGYSQVPEIRPVSGNQTVLLETPLS